MIIEPITQPTDLFATAASCLLAPYEIDTAGLQQVFGQMLVHNVDYADLYFQYNRAEGWAQKEVVWQEINNDAKCGDSVRAGYCAGWPDTLDLCSQLQRLTHVEGDPVLAPKDQQSCCRRGFPCH